MIVSYQFIHSTKHLYLYYVLHKSGDKQGIYWWRQVLDNYLIKVTMEVGKIIKDIL